MPNSGANAHRYFSMNTCAQQSAAIATLRYPACGTCPSGRPNALRIFVLAAVSSWTACARCVTRHAHHNEAVAAPKPRQQLSGRRFHRQNSRGNGRVDRQEARTARRRHRALRPQRALRLLELEAAGHPRLGRGCREGGEEGKQLHHLRRRRGQGAVMDDGRVRGPPVDGGGGVGG